MIMGIEARVVHDVVTEDGQLKEDTLDWYAQDKAGNLWYLGEDTKEYAEGKVSSTEGSWKRSRRRAGRDPDPRRAGGGHGLPAGVLRGEAEDRAKVVGVDKHADVPYGSFDGVLETEDTTPLEPDLVERKYYAKDVGPVLTVAVRRTAAAARSSSASLTGSRAAIVAACPRSTRASTSVTST